MTKNTRENIGAILWAIFIFSALEFLFLMAYLYGHNLTGLLIK